MLRKITIFAKRKLSIKGEISVINLFILKYLFKNVD